MHAARAGWSPAEVQRALSSRGGPQPQVDFVVEADLCPCCGEATAVEKSRTRIVVTLEAGVFQAREVLRRAQGESCRVYGSQELQSIVKRCQRYGYDVVVHVALARYLRGLQREEIQAELCSDYGIEVSTGTVSNLCDRFLGYLESLHVHRAPALRAAMEGGYPLHLDGTNDRGKGGTLVCMDGWRRWVLWAARIPSENAASILPVVNRTVELFGDPVGTMRDLSDAMAKAVEPLRERGAVDLVCDYHFLAAVGNKLLDVPYSRLRNALRVTGTRKALRELLGELYRYQRSPSSYNGRFGVGEVRDSLLALVLWMLEGEGRREPACPFGLPLLSLVHRCRQVQERVDTWAPVPRTQPERRALRHLKSIVARMDRRLEGSTTVHKLEEGWAAFCDLRGVLRHTDGELLRTDVPARQQTLPAVEASRRKAITDDLKQLEAELEVAAPTVGKKTANPSPRVVILNYLKTYGSKLIGHPIRYDSNGAVVAVMERTNNIAEHFFALNNRRLRRRVGRKHIGHDLDQQPAQAALALNLLRPDYVRVLCGSIENLPAAFAQLDATPHTQAILDRTTRDSALFKLVKTLVRAPRTNNTPAMPVGASIDPAPQCDAPATVS